MLGYGYEPMAITLTAGSNLLTVSTQSQGPVVIVQCASNVNSLYFTNPANIATACPGNPNPTIYQLVLVAQS